MFRSKELNTGRKRRISLFSNLIIVVVIFAVVGVCFPFGSEDTTYAVANPNVIYKGNEEKNNVSFMFNVYTGAEYIEDILSILDQYNVKTTFFVGGCWVAKNIETVEKIVSAGHELANHGFNHLDGDKLTYQQNYDEVDKCGKLIKANFNVEMELFAPPSGAYNDDTVDAAMSLGYSVIMWSKDTIDWRDKDVNLITNRATKNLSNGDLVLMHPTEKTRDALIGILAYATNNGFTPTTVSECIKK